MDRVARERGVAHCVGVARSADVDRAVLQLVEIAAGLDVAAQEPRELAVVCFADGEPFIGPGCLDACIDRSNAMSGKSHWGSGARQEYFDPEEWDGVTESATNPDGYSLGSPTG